MEHLMAVAQPFAVCAIFLAAGVTCLIKRGRFSGLGLVGIGFVVMAVGQPFLGMARLKPDYVELGNYVQGMTLPGGAVLVLFGLVLLRPGGPPAL